MCSIVSKSVIKYINNIKGSNLWLENVANPNELTFSENQSEASQMKCFRVKRFTEFEFENVKKFVMVKVKFCLFRSKQKCFRIGQVAGKCLSVSSGIYREIVEADDDA